MNRWPLALRLILAALVFAAAIWAFSTGRMALAVIGVVLCGVTFQRLFLAP